MIKAPFNSRQSYRGNLLERFWLLSVREQGQSSQQDAKRSSHFGLVTECSPVSAWPPPLSQAARPPSKLHTVLKPSLASSALAMAPREPAWQFTRIVLDLLNDPAFCANPGALMSMLTAPGTWPRANSSGLRTSSTIALLDFRCFSYSTALISLNPPSARAASAPALVCSPRATFTAFANSAA